MAAAATAAAAAASASSLAEPPPPPPPAEVPPWLKSLPLAPEYHPTLAEFQDPIAYILKIEKEASSFGICKIVPPLPAPPKKTTVANLNRSFAAREATPKKPPTFTTRQQQIGFCPRRPRPVQKPVWQSGEHYTLQQFETKAKQFERAYLKKVTAARKGGLLSPLEIETLFWKACADKPFSVEYANDMPGSGFAPIGASRRWREEEAANVGETAWNMRGVSRAKGSLLRFMKEEIPGVTSPMVYVAMMFSWFAWHVEDHELHSLNYLHMGASKTWYGVPRDAGLAFEEVVRVHGYGGEVNRLVTFALLGEKTTVMTPEVLIGAGIPCCRLVQNAGDFVVTFPGAYHTGFSHGFNCGEAANIATPGWLRVAKEAAIRRASINYPPMVSHFQLLYALALSFCTRMPRGGGSEPRSSRLKDKMKGEGEEMVKNIFVQNVIQNNHLLSVLLDKGSSCVVLPQNGPDSPLCSNSLVRSQVKVKPRLSLGLCSRQEALEASRLLPSNDIMLGRNAGISDLSGFCSLKGNSVSVCKGKMISSATCKFGGADFYTSSLDSQNGEGEKEGAFQSDGLLDQGLLSCVTCGILSFSCVAVIQPRDAAAKCLMSADFGFLGDHIDGSGEARGINKETNRKRGNYNLVSCSGQIERHIKDAVDDYWTPCNRYSVQVSEQSVEVVSDNTGQRGISALDLLASAYGDTSDTEEEEILHEKSVCTDENDIKDSPLSCKPNEHPNFAAELQNFHSSKDQSKETDLSLADCQNGTSAQNCHDASGSDDSNRVKSDSAGEKCLMKLEFHGSNQPEGAKSAGAESLDDNRENTTSNSSIKIMEEPTDFSYREVDGRCHAIGTSDSHQSNMKMGNPDFGSENISIQPDACCDSSEPAKDTAVTTLSTLSRNVDTKTMNSAIPVMQRCDKDSSRMHVFCLEHAAEVEKQLEPIGGVHIMLLCHPDYPKIEAEARLLAEELGIDYSWKDVHFKEATKEDQERIRAALEDEEAIPVNSDWAVKLGINLYYSASLSKSPLYSKQMPYNAVIYKAFGCNSPGNSPAKPKASGRRSGRQKKIVVAGRWCGKVWMSNQVHPYLAHRNESHERDHVEKLYSQSTGRKPKVETETEDPPPSKRNPSTDVVTTARKSGKKRKKPLRQASNKKLRCTQIENSEAREDMAETSSSPCGRVLRSSQSKRAEVTEVSNRKKLNVKDEAEGGPSTRLRKRPSKSTEEVKTRSAAGGAGGGGGRKQMRMRKAKKPQATNVVTKDEDGEYTCDIEGCSMSFSTKQDLTLHKRDICPVKGCGKKFFSHKYLVQHRKVHMDDRPLECPWKGCKMTFKWAWARTEHIRVHTGDRPYVCREPGCGQTFRFVSDFSRHKRKTGHSIKKGRR